MLFRQYFDPKLAQYAYLVGCQKSGEALLIDPERDIDRYIDAAEAEGLRIVAVAETHIHADFLSGHLELSAATGADIVYSSVAETEFEVRPVADGERITTTAVELEFLHTPGHTPESMSIVVYERPGEPPHSVLTGDTLFIGDVGRPDLLASLGSTRDELAEMLYESLHGKLLTLPDATRVYPAHGAGSACGKNLSTDTVSTQSNSSPIGSDSRTAMVRCRTRSPSPPTFLGVPIGFTPFRVGV